MAQPVRRKKTIYYKNFKCKHDEITLQSCLDEAFEQLDKPHQRQESLDNDGVTRRLVNSVTLRDGMLFGQILRYEAGRDQAVIVIDEDSNEFPIESFALPERRDGKLQEVLESVLYFGILDNHVLLLQSAALKARHFENHLNWLLRDQTGVLPDDTAVILSDEPTKETRRRVRRTPPKKVVIGAPVASKADDATLASGNQKGKVFYTPAGRGADILAAAIGANWMQKLQLDDSLDDANLRVQLEVTYLRKTTTNGQRLLENVGNACRNLEDEDVAIHLKGGGILKGEDLKLQGEVTVDIEGGVIDSQGLYTQMAAWLRKRIDQGSVG